MLLILLTCEITAAENKINNFRTKNIVQNSFFRGFKHENTTNCIHFVESLLS